MWKILNNIIINHNNNSDKFPSHSHKHGETFTKCKKVFSNIHWKRKFGAFYSSLNIGLKKIKCFSIEMMIIIMEAHYCLKQMNDI